ncbi:hypothetical protein [Streptococcus himalayensis]|uniref:Uncharacterized protein n=1 Tax=Streptococcus himalayensis TaxID=1888195 RepID=A0A917A9E9_9STRE|nr:hypothetical protein [Streptococcus himalayensis]GGE35936.1 hypothetical protein GCM10011510_16620 [Streptococcus himalayensis]
MKEMQMEDKELLRQLDRPIWMQGLGSSLYIYWTKKAYEDNRTFWKDAAPHAFHFGIALDVFLRDSGKESLVLIGYQDQAINWQKTELQHLEDKIDSFCILFAVKNQQLSYQQAVQLLQTKEVYFLETAKHQPVQLQRQTGEEFYPAIPCFLSRESAKEFQSEEEEIIKPLRLHQLARLSQQPILLEPDKPYGIEVQPFS